MAAAQKVKVDAYNVWQAAIVADTAKDTAIAAALV